ncbi:MAG: DNA polymerase III subunit delta [Firmicutes bacterium]|nr:DNA polymerase III subunit delta [Bacillota bacterium]
MATLKDQIKAGKIGRLYLLYGSEPFLVRLNARRLKEAVLTEEDEMMNLDRFKENADPDDLKMSFETLPFMSEKRMVLIENSGAFGKKAAAYESLEKSLLDLPETTVVLFIESDVDKRKKLYKTVQKAGEIYEFGPLGERELSIWIGQEFKKRRVRVDPMGISYLISLLGADMEKIQSEIEKLSSFAASKGFLTKEDMDLLVSPSIETKIFRLTDQLGNGRRADAYRAYQDLLKQNERPEMIFYMIVRQYHLLYRTSLMNPAGAAQVASALGVRDFAARGYLSQASRYGRERLWRLIQRLYEMDLSIKTGQITIQEALDLVILT